MIELKPIIRNDAAGSGHFDAPRGSRKHRGMDIVAITGQPVVLRRDMKFNRVGFPYEGDFNYKLMEFYLPDYDSVLVKLMYVTPRTWKPLERHTTYHAGTIIGYAQDIKARYPNEPDMQNHIHVEVIRNGKHENPAWWLGVGGE